MPKSWKQTIVIALVFLAAFGAVLWLFHTSVARNFGGPGSFCKANLRKIGLQLAMYTNDNGDLLPESVADLFPKYLSDTSVFVCADDSEMVRLWRGIREPEAVRRAIRESKWSYEYIALPSLLESDAPSNCMILILEKGFRHRDGTTVLFLDGHVERHRRHSLMELMEKMLTFAHVSPEQKAHWRGFIEGMKAEGK